MTMERYDNHRDAIQSGDCLLWQTQSVIGALIRWFSSANVNHASLVVRPHRLGSLKDRRFALEAAAPGVVLRLLSERLRNFEGRLWLYPLKPRFDGYRDEIVAMGLKEEGVPYDYWSLFKQIAGKVSMDAGRYFCSEFCYAAYRAAGLPVPMWAKAPRPGDLPKLPIFGSPVLLYGSDPP